MGEEPAAGPRARDRGPGLPAAGRRQKSRRRRRPSGRSVVAAGAPLAAAAVYAWFASSTTPFTTPANVTTAVPLVGMAAVYVLQQVRPSGAAWHRIPADRPPDGGTAVPWLAVLALLGLTELASFFAGPRSTHPTLSSLSDTLFQWHAAKAAVYFSWLWLCWYLVRR